MKRGDPVEPTTNVESIADLCARAGSGDHDAVEHLLWLHHGRLLGHIRSKIGSQWHGKIDAEDVLQEVYLDVFKRIDQFQPRDEDAFFRWVARIVDHRFIDEVRRHQRKKRDVRREVIDAATCRSRHEALLDQCVGALPSPSTAMRREEVIGVLMSCIAALPEDYQIVVKRLYLQGEPLAEIAHDMNRSPDAIRRLGSRAIERLRQGLGTASMYLSSRR